MFKTTIRTLACAILASAAGASAALVEGEDFEIAPDAAPAPAAEAEIRITEFFNFSCPACNSWQGPIDEWLESKPEGVAWMRSPVPFQRWDGLYAKTYFVLQAFDREDLTAPFFRAFHVERELLNSEGRIASWLADEHGLDEDQAEEAFGSFSVDTKMRKAGRVIKRFGINSTPTFLVADRYILRPSQSLTPVQLLQNISEIIEAIRNGTPPG